MKILNLGEKNNNYTGEWDAFVKFFQAPEQT